MTHYEERLNTDIESIRTHLLEMAGQVKENLTAAIQVLFDLDKPGAYQVVLRDYPINRQSRALDKMCHGFVARHLPSAGHLRFISSVLRMNISVERIGDYAVTISRLTAQLSRAPEGDVKREIENLAEDAFQMFAQALKAFESGNEELARSTRLYAQTVDRDFSDAYRELVQLGDSGKLSTSELFSLLTILNRLERVSDHAKNLCEYIDFAITGQIKKPKTYRVLFVDEKDDCRGPLAVAFARKAFGDVGEFESAGIQPENEPDSNCLKFLDESGHDILDLSPGSIKDSEMAIENFHVVVSLDHPITKYYDKIPFHTIALEWLLPAPPAVTPDGGEGEQDVEDVSKDTQRYSAIYGELAARITELMITIRGKEALS